MSDIDVKALREVLAKMSPRPWWESDLDGGIRCDNPPDPDGTAALYSREVGDCDFSRDDAIGMLACVNSASALLDRIEALEEGLREALDLYRHADWRWSSEYHSLAGSPADHDPGEEHARLRALAGGEGKP